MIHTSTRRLSAAFAVTAIGAGALVAMAAPVAQAAPVTTSYTCTPGAVAPFTATLVTDAPGLPPTANAGADIPADLLPVTNGVTISKETFGLFAFLQATEISLPDFALTAGEESVGVTGLKATPASFVASADGNTYAAQLNGKNAAFNAPAAGTHTVAGPAKFTLRATKADGSNVDVPCAAAAAPGAIASVTTAANESTITAKAKKVTVGKPAKVVVKVAAANEVPSGKVIAKIGTKKVGKGELAKGKVVVTVKAKFLKAGNNKVKLSYAGDDYTTKSKGTVVVKVAK